jgi:hypothetical protein
MARAFVYWTPPATDGAGGVTALVLFTGTNHVGLWNKVRVWLGTNLLSAPKDLSTECYGPGVAGKKLKAHGGFVEYNKSVTTRNRYLLLLFLSIFKPFSRSSCETCTPRLFPAETLFLSYCAHLRQPNW